MNICAHRVMYLVNDMPQGWNMPDKDILMSPEHTQADTDKKKVSQIYVHKHTISRQIFKESN